MPDLVVVGGGAIGLAVAWEAARSGAGVSLVDPVPGRGASWAAAGMLAPVTEVHYGEEATLAFNLLSARLYPAFVDELRAATDLDPGYRRSGTLMVARDADDNAALDDVFRYQTELGLAAARLRGRECRELEPGLAPSVRGGIVVEDDHQVDNRALVEALLRACAGEGVDIVSERAAGIDSESGRATGVRLDSGEAIPAGAVVIAAGAATRSIAGLPPEARVVRPVKGQLLHLRSMTGAPFTSQNVRGLDVYLVSRGNGRVVVGATSEESGVDRGPTAGAVHQLLDEARRLLPDVDELDFVEVASGLRPATPDNAPLLGPTSLEGLVLATGHYRNGILQTPATARAVVQVALAGVVPEEIAPFAPARFVTVLSASAGRPS